MSSLVWTYYNVFSLIYNGFDLSLVFTNYCLEFTILTVGWVYKHFINIYEWLSRVNLFSHHRGNYKKKLLLKSKFRK